jgi:hypothetical protein
VLAELEESGELEVRSSGRRRGRRALRALRGPLELLGPQALPPPLELLQVGSRSFQATQTKSEALPRW